jgi:hypothetical protein
MPLNVRGTASVDGNTGCRLVSIKVGDFSHLRPPLGGSSIVVRHDFN